MIQQIYQQNRILRAPEVCARTGLSLSWIHSLMSKGLFPKSFKIVQNGRAAGWHEAEIDGYIASRAGGKNNE